MSKTILVALSLAAVFYSVSATLLPGKVENDLKA